jgi:outer membrane protein TolC
MAYHVREVFVEGLQLAQERYTAVKQGAEFGDRPSIDTLEAGIQVQNRMLGLQQSSLDFANASAKLSIFLWDDGMIPLEVADGTLPSSLEDIDILAMDEEFLSQLDTLISNHPELAQYRIKLDQMLIDRRMKQEQLKPQLDLKYNFLTEPIGGNPIADLSPNNYTWGLKFTMPILLRKERNSLKMTELKINNLEFDIKTKNASLNYYAISSLNDWSTTREQIDLFTQTVTDYNGLLRGEQRMFDAGESSLFMVNAREVGYINSKIKLIELLAKNRKAGLTTGYAFGVLN